MKVILDIKQATVDRTIRIYLEVGVNIPCPTRSHLHAGLTRSESLSPKSAFHTHPVRAVSFCLVHHKARGNHQLTARNLIDFAIAAESTEECGRGYAGLYVYD